jgi:hypothetical protein
MHYVIQSADSGIAKLNVKHNNGYREEMSGHHRMQVVEPVQGQALAFL